MSREHNAELDARGWGFTQEAGVFELPIMMLDYGFAERVADIPPLAAEMREKVDAKLRELSARSSLISARAARHSC